MRYKQIFKLFSAVTTTAMLCVTIAAQSDIIKGRVIAISDGDTLTVLDSAKQQYKIRLQGVDAPERSQPFGTRARQQLSDAIFGKDVEVRVDKKDRYGRSVSVVKLNGADINLSMVQAGFAWHYKQYEREQTPEERRVYAEAEVSARNAKRGLWADADPTPPWNYRRAGRASTTGEHAPANADTALFPPAITGAIVGNRNSKIYHLPNCPNYNDVSPKNHMTFKTAADAEQAGYRKARNCP